jgi:hypothetical protein
MKYGMLTASALAFAFVVAAGTAQADFLQPGSLFTITTDNVVNTGTDVVLPNIPANLGFQNVDGMSMQIQETQISPGTEWLTFDFIATSSSIAGNPSANWGIDLSNIQLNGNPTLSEVVFDYGTNPGDLLNAVNVAGVPNGYVTGTTLVTGTTTVFTMAVSPRPVNSLQLNFTTINPFELFVNTNYTGVTPTEVTEAFIGAKLTSNVPEPASLAMLAAGLGFLGLVRRRFA